MSWMSSVSTAWRSPSSLGPAALESGAFRALVWVWWRDISPTSWTRTTSLTSPWGDHWLWKFSIIFHIPADCPQCGWTSTNTISMNELMILQSISEIFQRNVRKIFSQLYHYKYCISLSLGLLWWDRWPQSFTGDLFLWWDLSFNNQFVSSGGLSPWQSVLPAFLLVSWSEQAPSNLPPHRETSL